MNLRRIVWSVAWAAGAAISLQAHPGHAPFSEGAAHFLNSPAHIASALLFSLGLYAAGQMLKRRGERVFIRSIAIIILLVAVVS